MKKRLQRFIIGANASIFQKVDPKSNVAVFTPKTEQEIITAIDFARERDLPITAKGGGSGLSGACTGGSRDKVIISTSKLKTIHEINFQEQYAVVDAGVTPNELNEALQERKKGWHLYVSPSSRDIATVGGMVSTDGGGNDAWLAGTMIDNVLAIVFYDYNSNKIIIERCCEEDQEGITIHSENKELAATLRNHKMSLLDFAGSHGVLGFISRVKVHIKPERMDREKKQVTQALIHPQNLNHFGKILSFLVENKYPIYYGESVVEAYHPTIQETVNPPIFILECPTTRFRELATFCEKQQAAIDIPSKEEFVEIQDLRLNISKRNPPEGYQIGLFEGYGISGESLSDFEKVIKKINETLNKHHFQPFLKYGHSPSLWHHEGQRHQGIIMHSREVRPKEITSQKIFDVIVDLVDVCLALNVTPKPEHKWPYLRGTKKHSRLLELTKLLGAKFNPFILNCTIEELSEMVF
jgi:hypothetical protein